MNCQQYLIHQLRIMRAKVSTGPPPLARSESTTPIRLCECRSTLTAIITGHLIAREPILPPIKATMREYVFAGNGVFTRARRPGLEVTIPAKFPIPLLPTVEPYVRLDYPRVPESLVEEILARAREARDEQGQLIEMLFYLRWDAESGWQLEIPAQVQTRGQVAPLDHGANSPYVRAVIEVHSHHEWPAFFSKEWDDRDEKGFRIYAIIGRIVDRPELRTRVGLYGEVFEIPSAWIFQMPPRIRDCVAEEWSTVPAGTESSVSMSAQLRFAYDEKGNRDVKCKQQ